VLTGKTFEEVQRITSQPNGEIELVIKAYVLPLAIHSLLDFVCLSSVRHYMLYLGLYY